MNTTTTPYHKKSNKGYFTVAPQYRNTIPNNAHDITWDDTFFQNEIDEVVAVFDFDYDQMIDFYTPTKLMKQLIAVGTITGYLCFFFWIAETTDLLYFYSFIPLALWMCSGAPFLIIYQVKWQVYAQLCRKYQFILWSRWGRVGKVRVVETPRGRESHVWV